MNVLLLNTYAHGGAGIACRRLQAALPAAGVSADLLTADALGSRWPFYAERLSFLPYERDKSVRFSFSLANFGKNILKHPLVSRADVLHLHWINQGMLSLEMIHRLSETGKPIVWTLHDMWAFTGGCHYSRGCEHFRESCGNCPFLKHPGVRDLSNKVWQRKKRLYPEGIHFVTCSEWLAEIARNSGLLRDFPVTSIPNPIDTDLFAPLPEQKRAAWRAKLGIPSDALVLLFVAMNIAEPRKGFPSLLAALETIKAQNPDLQLNIVVLGKTSPDMIASLPYPAHSLGLINDTAALVEVYGAVDAFAIPSLEDNLPNTVMEALSCGTPVVGFETGGIPEMVGHEQEGWIAAQGDVRQFAAGVVNILGDEDKCKKMSLAARNKVLSHYSNAIVAERYRRLYDTLPGV
ncbi:MAG: glycosyltransferase family 4 protein [Saprospiraceae bacterium]|nr:glycosyltransferase family 4 protein [Saprospiraceae bacterium]MCB0574853.1 glycosyltransferase family 4 protein [Saprospiraceae bacterium]MCB9306746.1 glycosyltransferase family 4 protein [Lewinellaceae bacterium]